MHATLEARPDIGAPLAVVRQTAARHLAAVPRKATSSTATSPSPTCSPGGAGTTGVIDINPPPLTGDRAFDLATLLFYLYDRGLICERLHARALDITDQRALDVYLAHMMLRQVDWSLRHHPGTLALAHHLHLARLVASDLTARP